MLRYATRSSSVTFNGLAFASVPEICTLPCIKDQSLESERANSFLWFEGCGWSKQFILCSHSSDFNAVCCFSGMKLVWSRAVASLYVWFQDWEPGPFCVEFTCWLFWLPTTVRKMAASQFKVAFLQSAYLKDSYVITLSKGLSQFTRIRRTL